MKNINPTSTSAWRKLQDHYQDIKKIELKEAFKNNPDRATSHSIQLDDFYVDFSKNLINSTTVELLTQLAIDCKLPQAIQSYYNGDHINLTQDRAVLHTALRTPLSLAPNDIVKEKILLAQEAKQHMYDYVDAIHNQSITTHKGEKFDTVVNIGIGGSDLGPAMVYEALKSYKKDINVHFLSNIDGDYTHDFLKKINPHKTLFVIVSKSFGTQETLTNATAIRNWFVEQVGATAVASHFIAVTSNLEKATRFGINPEHIFPMFDWVGGRFSIWSTAGISIALAIGSNHFQELLDGAHAMDQHFKNTDFKDNIPVQLALLTIWYNNFFMAQNEAIIPYSQYLHRLPAYLQQGIMESNGKSTDRNGNKVSYQTGNMIWGEPGTNAQHAFFQLLHQGTKKVPAHFIAFAKAKHHDSKHHNILMANFVAQSQALMQGKTKEEVEKELTAQGKTKEEIKSLTPHIICKGNQPTTSILINQLTPASIGKLIAMYEHKIFIEGVIWNINSYDQWGVALGKHLAGTVLTDLESNNVTATHDSSTSALITQLLSINNS